MAFVLCLKHLRIISKTGHSVALVASRKPQAIVDALLPEALVLGCVESNEAGQALITGTPVDIIDSAPVDLNAAATPDPSLDLPVRERRVLQAVKTIVESPDATEITTTGVPRVFAVSERCGFKVSQSEVMQSLKQLGY